MPNCTTSLCKQLIGILNSVKTFYFPEQKKNNYMNAIVFLWKLVNGKNRTPLNDIVSSLGVTSLISSNFLSLAMLGPFIAMWLQFFGETFFCRCLLFNLANELKNPLTNQTKFHFILHSKNGNRLKIQFTICLNDWINSMRH